MLRQNKSFPGLKVNLFGGQYHCGLMKIDLWIMISKPKANSQTNGFRAETPLFRWQWNLKMLTHAKIEINWTSSWKVIAQKFQFSLFEKITLHSCLLTRKMKFTRILTYFSFLVKKIVFQHHFCNLFQWPLIFKLNLMHGGATAELLTIMVKLFPMIHSIQKMIFSIFFILSASHDNGCSSSAPTIKKRRK